MKLAVVIPAFNEEAYLPRYLPSIISAARLFSQAARHAVEIVLVDNGSTDATAAVAASYGIRVIRHDIRGIGSARNRGALETTSDLLVFLDADVQVPNDFLLRIVESVVEERLVGGAAIPIYTPRTFAARLLCKLWSWYAPRRNMAQGVAQFASRAAFDDLGGYDETLYMAEDTDFYWRLCQYAEQRGLAARVLQHLAVYPSNRRYDIWPAWKSIMWTNPITTRLFLRSRRMWRHWYDAPPR